MPPGGATADRASSRALQYCRNARRIRGREAGRPGRLYRALRELSDRQDAAGAPLPLPLNSPTPIPRAEAFAAEVAGHLEGPILRQSRRRALVAAARRMGIGRFEANLIIAAVQHENGRGRPAPPESPAAGTRWHLATIAFALALQATIAWAAWQVLGG